MKVYLYVTPMATQLPLPLHGIDLLSGETALPAGTVRTALNVDIDSAGQFARRDGWSSVVSGDWRNLYTFLGALYAQRGAQVLRVNTTDYSTTLVCELDTAHSVDFTQYNGSLYIAQNAALWRLQPGSDAASRLAPNLPPLPVAEPAASGALLPGRYTVAVGLVYPDKSESQAVVVGRVQTEAGIRLTGLSVLPGHAWRIYLTPANGDVLYLAEEIAATWTQYTFSTAPMGAQCQTLYMAGMPGGHLVRGFKGRLYVARGSALWYSEPLRPHLTRPQHNFIPFVGGIRLMEFVAGGAFVADDRGVWWLAGDDPTQWRMTLADDAQPVMLSGMTLAACAVKALKNPQTDDVALWLSTKGHMVGTPDGHVVALNSSRIVLAPDQVGRSVYLRRDGVAQVVTLTASLGQRQAFGTAIDTKDTP